MYSNQSVTIRHVERIMSTCTICLSSEFNVSMLTAVNLNVVKLMTEALLSKTEKLKKSRKQIKNHIS